MFWGRGCDSGSPTFLRVPYFLSGWSSFDHHVQQQPAESLHHWVRLADLHLQGVGVVSVGWMGSEVKD